MAKSKNRALANGIAAGLSVAGLACIGIALFALVGEEERSPRPTSEVSVGAASRNGAADVPKAVEATVLKGTRSGIHPTIHWKWGGIGFIGMKTPKRA